MELITDVGLAAFADAAAVELPYGRKRALEIATTLALDPEMLLLDEPTAGMGHEDIDRISQLIKRVAANRTVLMVEHNLWVVADISDRITVLTRGRVLAEGDYATVSQQCRRARSLHGSRPCLSRARRCSRSRTCRPGTANRTSCTASNFDVHEGEVVTLLGRNGAGKTTTLKSIMGIVGQRTGSVRFEGRELIGLTSDQIARAGIAFCPEERGIFASLGVEENLLLPPQVRPGGLSLDRIFEMFPNLKERLGSSQGTKLSGGEQQMLAIAPHPAHRRAPAAARRADRGARARHHPADRQDHPRAEGAGLHDIAG